MANFAWEEPAGTIERRSFIDLRFEEVVDLLGSLGHDERRAARLFGAIHRRGVTSFDELDGLFPRDLIRDLKSTLTVDPVSSVSTFPSADGAIKFVFRFWDDREVEAVLMPFGKRTTLCISSQVGCAMGCTFCATGAMGLTRHLRTGEMVAQVRHLLAASGGLTGRGDRVNVVFMGMGEPLHNLEEVLGAHEILTHPRGLVLSERDVAVSTSGLVSRIEKMALRRHRPQLMVSIAATTDEARSALMPVNRAWPLETLLDCLGRYPLRKRERILLGYVVIAGQNDSLEDARRLASMAGRFPSIVNLIPMNPHPLSPGMDAPEEQSLQRFYQRLLDHGAFATIRRSRGRDVSGACGQLIRARTDL